MHKSELMSDTRNWAEARQRSRSRRINKRFLLGYAVHQRGFRPFIHTQFSLQSQSQFTSISRSIDIHSTSSYPLFANLYIHSLCLSFPSFKVRTLKTQSGIQSVLKNIWRFQHQRFLCEAAHTSTQSGACRTLRMFRESRMGCLWGKAETMARRRMCMKMTIEITASRIKPL